MSSSRILEVIDIAQLYGIRPSNLVGVEDAYEAFCFDEACAFIQLKMMGEEEPKFKKVYKSFKDLYKDYE